MTIPAICFRRVRSLQRLLRIHRINDTFHIQWRAPWDGRDHLASHPKARCEDWPLGLEPVAESAAFRRMVSALRRAANSQAKATG